MGQATQQNEQEPRSLPTIAWYLLAPPTFFMPLVYAAVAVRIFAGLFAGQFGSLGPWWADVIYTSLYITAGLCPVYIAWVALSGLLTRAEKAQWLFMVVLLNMVGMPMFYVYMAYRHRRARGGPNPRSRNAVDSFLEECGRSRDELSQAQLEVLQNYFRARKRKKWSMLPVLLFAALALYIGGVFMPTHMTEMLAFVAPTRVRVVDSSGDTRKVISPDPRHEKQYGRIALALGGVAGLMAATGAWCLGIAVNLLLRSSPEQLFIDFLEAGASGTDGEDASAPR